VRRAPKLHRGFRGQSPEQATQSYFEQPDHFGFVQGGRVFAIDPFPKHSAFFLVLREIPRLLTERTGSDHDFENGRIARKLPDTERLILGGAAFSFFRSFRIGRLAGHAEDIAAAKF